MKTIDMRIMDLQSQINGSDLNIVAIREQLSELTQIVSEIAEIAMPNNKW